MQFVRLCIVASQIGLAYAGSRFARRAPHDVQDFGLDFLPVPSITSSSTIVYATPNLVQTSSHVSAPYPTSIRDRPWNTSSQSPSACECTVNAVAGLAWWYPEALLNVLGRVTTINHGAKTSYSFQPFTTTFDAQEALRTAGGSINYVESWDAVHNTSTYYTVAVPGPTPTAALTVFTTVSDVRSAVPTTIFDVNELIAVFRQRPPIPTYVVPVAGGSQAFLTATPYDNILYLTQLEVAYGDQKGTALRSLSSSCQAATPTVQSLQRAIAIPFEAGDDLRTVATPSGTLDSKLSAYLPYFTNCAFGTWSAPSPTMIVVVEVTVERDVDFDILVHQEHTETSLDGPSPPPTDSPSDGVPFLGLAGPGLQDTPPTTTETPAPQATGSPGPQATEKPGFLSIHIVPPQTSPIALSAPQGPGLELSGQTITPDSSVVGFIVDGMTLPGGQAITQGGSTTISLGPGPTPNMVVINGSVQQLASVTQPPSIYFSGTACAEQSDGCFVIGSQTLSPGQNIVVAGSTLSLGAGTHPSIIVINGVTSSLTSTTRAVLSISGRTYTATNLLGPYIIAGQTLSPAGTPITISGSTISLQSNGSVLVVNGHTSTLSPVAGANPTSSRASVQQTNTSRGKPRAQLSVMSISSMVLLLALLYV